MKKIVAIVCACVLMSGCSNTTKPSEGNEVTGLTGQVNVYTRDASSGTREAFEKGVDFEGELVESAIEVGGNGEMASQVGNDKNGIGYTSLSTDFEANNIVAVDYEGVVASNDTVLDGSYKLQRPFDFVTRASGDFESDEKEALIAAFIDYLQNSKEGLLVVEKAGGIVDMSQAKPWAELSVNHPIVTQDNSVITIVTAGSTSVTKTLQAALESFQPMAGNYKFTMNQTGSGDGWKRVLGSEKDGANKADIGFASREFKADSEDITGAKLSGTYCVDAVVAVVNKTNTENTNFTQTQLKDIFTGVVKNWEDMK